MYGIKYMKLISLYKSKITISIHKQFPHTQAEVLSLSIILFIKIYHKCNILIYFYYVYFKLYFNKRLP